MEQLNEKSERKSIDKAPAGGKIANRHARINASELLATESAKRLAHKKAKPPSLQQLQATGGLAWAEQAKRNIKV